MTPNPNPSPELREERSAWLRDRLLYAIQFHMWADATAAEVEEVIESLSDSDEYDPNVAALVQMPKWCSPFEAQQGVDAFFALSQTLPAPGEVEQQAKDMAARIIEDITGREWPAKRDELARLILRNYRPLVTVAAANDEGVADTLETVLSLLTPPGNAWRGDEPAWQTKAYALVRAAIRLLSQGGGK